MNLHNLGITELNLMQQETADTFRKKKDIVLLSPTGSGKTLAYLLPLLQHINVADSSVQAVVMVPSRELAMQTHDVIKKLTSEVRSFPVYGGRPAMEEHRSIRGMQPQVIIGTPGRVLDHLNKGNLSELTAEGDNLTNARFLVIDEFDKSLELGFQEEMANVMGKLPNIEQRVLLSATDCPQIPQFVGVSRNTEILDYTDKEQPISERIEVGIVRSSVKDKLDILRTLLCTLGQQTSMVFVGYRESVERVANFLRKEGFAVAAFHGGMEQKDRERALYRFVGGSDNIMVCTDLGARGLDIPALDNVIQYHLPLDKQAYIHRNGRTARWDRTGHAWVIVGPEEDSLVEKLDLLDGTELTWTVPHSVPAPAKPAWATLYIGKGKKDKLSKGDIAGFMMKIAGLSKEQVGRIDVRDHWSFVSIAFPVLKETLARVRGQKIKGMKTIIEPTR